MGFDLSVGIVLVSERESCFLRLVVFEIFLLSRLMMMGVMMKVVRVRMVMMILCMIGVGMWGWIR